MVWETIPSSRKFPLTFNTYLMLGSCVALVTQDGSESERLEDLVAPSHVNTQVDRTVRTLEWISFTGFILELV